MQIRPIRTESDYKNALKQVSRLIELDPDINSAEGEQLEVLSTLIQAYETKNFPIERPDPIEAIKFRMEQNGLTAKDLEPMIGRRNRVYEILNHKRPLTLAMIWRLHKGLGIPAEILIQPPASS
ncbi:Antitoxin HigA [Oligella ureolytica]|jgi:HTH-type transcriptional regulator/antitoxin HigA|uniref:Antitoxin HigA n=1 Tax=Oligella ureolytica TaxID=90244 RepID=A0A378XFD4_9BURK|nr:transcriptional regulator [Oligella ureolytica]NLJ51685.1 transcriptional regulator [Alcaligenaceae bacterium]QPT39047.1 transcriptional regulator [Oligella ureolytica]SUA54133.1 Antitoxin HigA [Oligella ureolytica]SUA54630.1 Antitoxin HigA [Oligella ureolytica]